MYSLTVHVSLQLLFVLVWTKATCGMDVVFATVVWRHGDRSYIQTYPTDPYKDEHIWKNGPGQLTNIGMRQQYELGRFLRERYGKILNATYRRDEIYIQSTDKDRTLMSAESNMAGLYPPTEEESWNGTNTAWHPIPIHTVPLEMDKLLRYPIGDCPNYDKIRTNIKQSPWYIEHEKNYSEFYEMIMNKTGLTQQINLTNIWGIEDNLFCLWSNNYTLPDWAQAPGVMDKLKALNSLDMGLLFTDYEYKYRDTMSQMQGGMLLKEILRNMSAHIHRRQNRSMIAYSAHDTTLAALLVAIGNYEWVQPKYASCLMFELLRKDENYFVRILYRKSTGAEATLLTLYECNSTCPFETFEKISERLIPEDRKKLCGVVDDSSQPSYYVLLALIPGGILVLLIVTLLFSCRTRKKHDYQRLDCTVNFEAPI